MLVLMVVDSRDDFEKSCVICGKKKNKHFDLDDRQQFKMVERNLIPVRKYMEQGLRLAEVSIWPYNAFSLRVLSVLRKKFQETHDKRYIAHLEKEVANLKLENT